MEKHLASPSTILPAMREGLGKKQIAAMAEQLVAGVLEEGNPFQVAEALAAMEEFTRAVRKDERYLQYLRDELLKHQGRLVTPSGARLETCEAGIQYDYGHSAEWRALEAELNELNERKKAVEEKMRQVGPGKIAVDPETGEVIEGALKSSKSTYRITLSR